MNEEKFKDILGFEGLYKIGDLGTCLRFDKAKNKFVIKKPIICTNGYIEYQLYKKGKRYCKLAHRLVAEAFIPNPYNKPEVNHKDEDITNNKVSNLEWMTSKENANYGTRIERCSSKQRIPIVQLSLDGQFIRRWSSCAEAERELGIGSENFIRCCKHKRKTSLNSIWLYESEYLKNKTISTEVIE